MVENAFTLKGETIGIRTAYFSQAVTSDPTAIRQPATMSTVMRDFFGKEPGLVYAWIGAEISDARTSRILGIAEGAPSFAGSWCTSMSTMTRSRSCSTRSAPTA